MRQFKKPSMRHLILKKAKDCTITAQFAIRRRVGVHHLDIFRKLPDNIKA